MLEKMSSLATRDEIKAVTEGIGAINDNLTAINTKLEELEPRIKATEDRLDVIEKKLENYEDVTAKYGSETIIEEMNDRAKRARNVLLHNIPECKSHDVKVRIASDKEVVDKLIQAAAPVCSKSVKVIRVGKPNMRKPRPMKIIFNNDAEAQSFTTLFDEDAIRKLDPVFADISISRDRTLQERKYLQSLRSELDRRTNNGEKGLTIKYRNGIPVITQNQRKNE
ncbi:hypothetical protein J6590_108319 [Homalodisca vitripennis]|nr:hypothetical protein J6590_108319 [Homalodisca vitripennis]